MMRLTAEATQGGHIVNQLAHFLWLTECGHLHRDKPLHCSINPMSTPEGRNEDGYVNTIDIQKKRNKKFRLSQQYALRNAFVKNVGKNTSSLLVSITPEGNLHYKRTKDGVTAQTRNNIYLDSMYWISGNLVTMTTNDQI